MRLRTIITGCELQHHNHWAHGDLWVLGDTFIFNAVLNAQGEVAWEPGSPPHGRNALIVDDDANFFDRRGVFVVHQDHAQLNPDAQAYVLRAEGRL